VPNARLTVTFALPHGGRYRARLRSEPEALVSIFARGSIARVIARASAPAKRRGRKLGTCLRITRGGQTLFDYQLDNGGRA
jgi:hypothetical protein